MATSERTLLSSPPRRGESLPAIPPRWYSGGVLSLLLPCPSACASGPVHGPRPSVPGRACRGARRRSSPWKAGAERASWRRHGSRPRCAGCCAALARHLGHAAGVVAAAECCVPGMDTGNGYREWIPGMDTGNGYHEWIPGMDTGNGYREARMAECRANPVTPSLGEARTAGRLQRRGPGERMLGVRGRRAKPSMAWSSHRSRHRGRGECSLAFALIWRYQGRIATADGQGAAVAARAPWQGTLAGSGGDGNRLAKAGA